jgi:hypothetical protein
MSFPLVTLTLKIVCHIIRELPIKDGRIFLESCKKLYNNRIYAFDKKCFCAILVCLTEEGLNQARQLLKDYLIYFL